MMQEGVGARTSEKEVAGIERIGGWWGYSVHEQGRCAAALLARN
jgi:hypothetical protein